MPGIVAVVNIPTASLREGPGSEYPSLGNYTQGTQLGVIGRTRDGQWLQVTAPDGTLGWIVAQYVQLNRASGSVPVVGVPSPQPTEAPPTPPPGTLPGTILEAGQAWLRDDLELTLVSGGQANRCELPDSSLEPECSEGMLVAFQLTSRKSRREAISYNLFEVVSAMDNLSRTLDLRSFELSYGWEPTWGRSSTQNVTLEPDQTADLHTHCQSTRCNPRIFVRFDAADPAVTEIVLTVSRIGGIEYARWRIPVLR
jgi:hypothetical protein